MNLLAVENITKSFTERKLFDQTSFYLNEGEKVGIIGINGTGKSTLLRMIAGLEQPERGTVTMANNTVIRFLSQHPSLEPGHTVLEAVLAGNQREENLWSMEADAKSMLGKLGITDFSQPCGQLSGGQKKRLALVSVLLLPADILVLDEPTNHLDNEMADWLEDYLKKWRGALVMVTHDRYFLDSVSNRIVEIDKGKIYSYQTNYSGFLALKAEREEMALAAERKRKSLLRTELEWLMRGARARSTKQKAHIQRIEQMRAFKGPAVEEQLVLSSVSSRLGRSTVELSHISKAYGSRVLIQDFSYIFLKEDRVGFIGKNGCGKTTLMKLLNGTIQLDMGEISIGQTVKIGYYAQEIRSEEGDGLDVMDPEKRVIDYIRDTAEYVKTAEGTVSASQMLERFLFPADMQYSPLGKLSGGEKRRLNLLRVLMEAPNVLILDEPTNDLDIATLTILEDYLDHYKGIVIIVSHDRYFLDRTVRRIFAFEENGELVQYEGGYTDYINKKREKEEAARQETFLESDKNEDTGENSLSKKNRSVQENADKEKNLSKKNGGQKDRQAGASRGSGRSHEKKLKFSYKEQKEFETIDEVIAGLEADIAGLEQEILKASTDFVKLNELSKQKEQKEQELEERMERWMYLNELKEQMDAR